MIHATTCKFCHLPISVQVDDTYAETGDPFKIIKLAACNWCADVRVSRRKLEAHLARVCRNWQLLGADPKPEQREKFGDILTRLTQAYARMVSKWHRKEGCIWDEACVQLLLDKPERWGEIVGQLWKLYEDWEKEQCTTRP